MDVVVNAKFKNALYYQWAMWMMNGPRRVQPKSGNFIAADFVTVLSWCAYAWGEVKKETILSGVAKCYMSADPGPKFEVEAKPEEMQIEREEKKKKQRKKIVVVKSKTLAELERLAKKKERARKKIERERKKLEKEKGKKAPKRKATPKRKKPRKSPKRRVQRRKVQRKQNKRKQK